MLWLQDKLRPVERGVKGSPKKSELIGFEQHKIELKYSQLHPLTSTGGQPDFRRFRTASPPLTRRESASESADFPRLFRMFCTQDCALFFPQRLRSDFAGISELGRREKWRKASESGPLRKNVRRWPLAVCRAVFLFRRPTANGKHPTISRGTINTNRWIQRHRILRPVVRGRERPMNAALARVPAPRS
jgi:hypothetical protein